MKKTALFSVMASGVLVLGMSSCDCKKGASLKTNVDSVSYAYGMMVASNVKPGFDYLKKDSVTLNLNDFLAGLGAAVEGDSLKMKITQQQAMDIMQAFNTKMQAKAMEKQQKEAVANLEAGKKFLDDKSKEAGIQKTESGLMYKVEKEGTGAKPTADSRVKVNYKGTLIDGTVFDSSYDRGEPTVFGVSQVIPGWTEGLQLMPVGSKYTFFIPAELAYGERGGSQLIGPNAALVFEVELLDIEK